MKLIQSWLLVLFNMAGLYDSAQAQAALVQLVEASGNDVTELAIKAQKTVTEKREKSALDKETAATNLADALRVYQSAKNDSKTLNGNGVRLAGEADLVEKSALLMGLKLTPKADNSKLKKI